MLPLSYVTEVPTQLGEVIRLVGDEGFHAASVLRLQKGEEHLLSDGRGRWSRTQVVAVGKRTVDLSVLETGFRIPRDVAVTVVQGVVKSDRTRENIELLVASGVNRIVPWEAKRSVGKLPRGNDKWKIAVRGAEALAENLVREKKQAALYRQLATLRYDVPLKETLADLEWKGGDLQAIEKLSGELADPDLPTRLNRWREG